MAERQGLCREAVRVRRRTWLKSGLASLPDRPRCGAPSKLTDAQRQQLGQWVESEALSSRELLPFKSFTPVELEQAIDKIGAGFGSDCQLAFR